MSNTPTGGKNLRLSMIEKFGTEEVWRRWMATIGAQGGANGTGHKFGHGKVDPAIIGSIGGKISKRESRKKGH